MFTEFFNPGNANLDLNSLKSMFAETYGHDKDRLIKDVTNGLIFNAMPKMFMDLRILGMKDMITKPSDEFFYGEMGWQRNPLYVTTGDSGDDATKVITVQNVDDVAVNMIIVYQDNSSQGTVIAVDRATNQVTIQADSGTTLGPIADGSRLIYQSPIEGDGQEGWAHLFRAKMFERYNYVQFFSMGIEYDEVELKKIENNHAYKDFLKMEQEQMMIQFRTSLSNALWNGKRGEATIMNNGTLKKAKKMGGILHTMFDAGSPSAQCTSATIREAVEDIAIATEYNDYGQRRFLFAESSLLLALSKAYKNALTRYAPNDDIAKLTLSKIEIGSSEIVLVPMNRFRDRASFPDFYRQNMLLIDMENIKPCDFMPARTIDVNYDARKGGGRRRKGKEIGVDASLSLEFNNPLACGIIKVSDMGV